MRAEKTGRPSLSEALKKVIDLNTLVPDITRPGWGKYSPAHYEALKRNIPDRFGFHPHAKARQVRHVLGRKILYNDFKFGVERNPRNRQVSLYMHRKWQKKNPSLNFDKDIQSCLYRATVHVKLINWSIYSIGDQVLRYENLADELEQLRLNLKFKTEIHMPRPGKYTDGQPRYSTYYSQKTRDMVGRWHKRTIDALGYQFKTAA